MDKWCWRHGAGLLLASVLLVASSMAVAESADSPVVAESAIPNPFEGWEAWQLGGGVKLWFKQLAGAETVRVSATLPVGAQNDPEGLEGLAHFVEHVMFTDDRGRTEEEIKKEVKERGGSANGFTRLAATHYFADLPRAEWRFGLRWIHDRVFHGLFAESVVEGERKAVLLEGSLKPKEALRSLLEVVFKPEWREMPGLWEREFGLERDDDPVLGTWESVQAIRLEDLQDFYDTWYGPQNMTFVVIGDLDAKEVRAWGAELFAGLEPRGQTAVVRQAAEDPGRFRRIVDYEEDSGTTEYGVLYKVYDMTEGDYIKLLFLRQLLYEELTEKLRVRRKTTYGIDSDVRNYAGHGYLEISGKFAPEEVEYAREAIDESFESLRQGSLPPERFVELKERVISTFSLHWQDPASLDAWTPGLIANGISFAGFPNVVGAMRSYSQPEIASWVRENFTEDHRVETIERVLPVSLGLCWVLLILCLLGFVRLLRRLWIDDVNLTRLRYVRKFKYPVSYIAFLGGGLLCLVVFGIQGLLFLSDWADFLWFHGVDHFAFAIAMETLWSFSMILLIAMVLSRIPVKLLLFEHEWRVKYFFCRSKGRPYSDIRELREAGFFETLFSRRALGTGFLYWSAFRKGVYLRFGPRRAVFFDTRDNQEMIEQLERFAEQQRVTGSAARSRMPEERGHGLLPASGLAATLSGGLSKTMTAAQADKEMSVGGNVLNRGPFRMELSIPRVVVLRLQILTVLAFVSTLLLLAFGEGGAKSMSTNIDINFRDNSWSIPITLQSSELALLGGACSVLLLALYGLRLHSGKRVIEVREGVLSRPWSFWGWRNRRVKLGRDTRMHRMRWLGQPALAVSEGFLPLVVRASEVGGEAGLQRLKLALDEERGRLFGSTLLSENLREEREIENRLSVVPWVTLAFASVALFLYALFPLSAAETEPSAFQLVFAGSWIVSDEPAFFADWHRFASYALFHLDWKHLGMNLGFILLFGTMVERTLGRSRLVLIMALCAAVSPLLGLALLQNHGPSIEVCVGASAIAYGLVGSFAVLWVAKGRLLSCAQRSGLLFLVVVFLGCGPLVSVDPADFEPANFLHLVGLVVGAVVTAVLVKGSVRSIAPPARALKASAAMLGLLFAAAGLRTISWVDQPLPDFVDWARSRYSESSMMSSFLLYDPSLNAARRTLSEEVPPPVDVLLAAWVAADAPSPPEDLLREAIARLEELEPEDFIEICEDDSSSCESLGSKQVQEKLHERLHESWETQAAAG